MIKKKCIQFQVGDQIYQFNDVGIESTSLSGIIKGILNNPENRNKINDILSNKPQDLGTLLDSGSYSAVGDNAIGNTNINNLLTILRSYKDPLVEQGFDILASKLSYTDNNILVTNYNNPTTIYQGSSRDFLIVGKDVLQNPKKIFNAISYLYVSKELKNANSKIFRIFSDGIDKVRDSIPELLELSADSRETLNKLVLAKLPQLVHNPLIVENILNPIARVIKEETPKEIPSMTTLQLSKIMDLANTTTNINGNDYSNGFILKTLDKISKFTDNSDRIGDKLRDSKLYKYFQTLNESDPEFRLLNDIVNNTDPEFINNVFEKTNYRDGILNYMYNPIEVSSEVTVDNERFYPIVDKVNIDDDFAVKDSRIGISSYNNTFNTKITKNASGSFQLVINNKQSEFAKVDNSAKTVKILINPNRDYTPEYLEIIKKAITKTKNKRELPNRTTLYILKQKDSYSSSNSFSKIAKLIRDLRTNNNYINRVYVAGVQDFALDVAKAANENGISTTVYPEYYGTIRAFGDVYSYLDNKLNLNYLSNYEDVESDINDIINDKQRVIKINNTHREGDTIVIRKGKETVNKIVDKVIDMTKPSISMDLYEHGRYKIGSVVMTTNDKGKVVEGIVTHYADGVYSIYNTSNAKVESSRSINPIYSIDSRFIDGNIYIPFKDRIYKISPEGIIKPLRGVEDFALFYNDELTNIYENTNTNESFEDFVSNNFSKLSDFGKYVILKPFIRENLNSSEVLPDNYSNRAVIELLVGSLRRSGLNVNFYDTDYIRENFGEEASNHKAFIHNGGIILNSDKYTEDSPLHELMHLLLGQYKLENPTEYRNLLQQVPNTQEYTDLAQTYSELTAEDYAEEVLVHVLTDTLMGKIYDRNINNMINVDIRGLAQRLLKSNNEFRETPDFLNTTLSKLLIDSNSQILNDLIGGERRSDIVLNNQISNLKSKLLKNQELKQECK